MAKILNSLSTNYKKRKIAKSIVCGLGIATFCSFLYAAANIGNWFWKNLRPSNIAEDLLLKNTEKHDKIAYKYILDNSSLLDLLSEKYEYITGLERVFFPSNNPIDTNLATSENENRIEIDGKVYFSADEVSEKSRLIAPINMLHDPKNKLLYRVNGSLLEKSIGDVESVLTLNDSTYFAQGDSVFQFIGTNVQLRYKGNDTCKLREIIGTGYGIIFSGKEYGIIGNNNEKAQRDIDELLKQFYEKQPFIADKETKIQYDDGILYISDKNHVYIIEKDKETIDISASILEYFNDFIVRDVDGKPGSELAVANGGTNVYVFKDGKKQYSVNTPGSFDFDKITYYRWLNPDKLKKDIKNMAKGN